MSRRRHLIAYDICDPKRLRRVIKVMEAYGQRIQYSVFLCDLSGAELVKWRADMLEEVNLNADSVLRLDLGPLGNTVSVEALGTPRRMPSHGPTIV